MTSPHQEFNDTPLAYFLTFRTYGTWLHGDVRGSVDRHHNVYGTPRLPPNKLRQRYEERLLKMPPVKLTGSQRKAVELEIKETCKHRNWVPWAVNARTNHVHGVITASQEPELVLNALRPMRHVSCEKRACGRARTNRGPKAEASRDYGRTSS